MVLGETSPRRSYGPRGRSALATTGTSTYTTLSPNPMMLPLPKAVATTDATIPMPVNASSTQTTVAMGSNGFRDRASTVTPIQCRGCRKTITSTFDKNTRRHHREQCRRGGPSRGPDAFSRPDRRPGPWERHGGRTAGDGRCRCREFHPCWSGGVVVFVDDAAEAVSSADVEPGELVLILDGLQPCSPGSGAVDSAVRRVLVVVRFVLAQ